MGAAAGGRRSLTARPTASTIPVAANSASAFEYPSGAARRLVASAETEETSYEPGPPKARSERAHMATTEADASRPTRKRVTCLGSSSRKAATAERATRRRSASSTDALRSLDQAIASQVHAVRALSRPRKASAKAL